MRYRNEPTRYPWRYLLALSFVVVDVALGDADGRSQLCLREAKPFPDVFDVVGGHNAILAKLFYVVNRVSDCHP